MTTFATALQQAGADAEVYLLIEGIPWGFGTVSHSASWFASSEFEGVKPWFRWTQDGEEAIPSLSMQAIDHLEGTVGIGSAVFAIADMADADISLAEIAASRRTDEQVRVSGAAASGVPTDAVDVAAGDLSIKISNTLATPGSDLAGWPTALTTYYVDGETLQATRSGAVLTVPASGRGLYRSPDTIHHSQSALQRGAFISQYPRYLVGRKAWLRMGLDAASDSDCVTLWAGVLTDTSWIADGQVLKVNADDQNRLLEGLTLFGDTLGGWDNVELFQRLVDNNTKIAWMVDGKAPTVANGDEIYAIVSQEGTDGSLPGLAILSRSTALDGNGIVGYTPLQFFKGLEIVGWSAGEPVTIVSMNTQLQVQQLMKIGRVRRVIAIHGPDALETQGTITFSTAGNHVLQVVLQVLLSTGDGTNFTAGDASGTASLTGYDTLPFDGGAAFRRADVDVAAFEKFIDTYPHELCKGIIDGPIENARSWITSLLRPYGYYLIASWNGLISVKKISEPTPNELGAATAISFGDLVVDSVNRQPTRLDGPVISSELQYGSVAFSSAPSFAVGDAKWSVRGEPLRVIISNTLEDLSRRVRASVVEIKAPFIHRWSPETPYGAESFFDTAKTAAYMTADSEQNGSSAVAANIMAAWRTRFAEPATVIEIEVWPKIGMTLDVGDWVVITDTIGSDGGHMPNARSSSRGLTTEVFEVFGKQISLKRGTSAPVTLRLAQTAAGNKPARFLAPSLLVVSFADDTPIVGESTITVQQNAFSPGSGSGDDTGAFIAEDPIRVYSTAFATSGRSETALVVSKTATTIVIDETAATLLMTPAAGDVVELADYTDGIVARLKAKYAFRAGNDEKLDTDDEGHIHS